MNQHASWSTGVGGQINPKATGKWIFLNGRFKTTFYINLEMNDDEWMITPK